MDGIKDQSRIGPGDKFQNGRYVVEENWKSFGQGLILLVRDTSEPTNPKRILKMVDKESIDTEREIKIHQELCGQSDHVVQYFDNFSFAGVKACIITEYCEGGDLGKKISEGNPFDLETITRWCREILQGLVFLHSKGIVHRDLKPSNIFLTANGCIKIGDLGLSKKKKPEIGNDPTTMTRFVGTAPYMSPELINELKEFSSSQIVDIWAFGCILYELVVLKKLFRGENERDIMDNIANSPIEYPQNDTKLLKIMQKCLERDPGKRASAAELLEIIEGDQLATIHRIVSSVSHQTVDSTSSQSSSQSIQGSEDANDVQPGMTNVSLDSARPTVKNRMTRDRNRSMGSAMHMNRLNLNQPIHPRFEQHHQFQSNRPFSNIQCVTALEGHKNSVLCLKIQKEKGRLVSGSRDHVMRIWDLNKNRKIAKISSAHKSGVWCLERVPNEFYPDSILSGGGDRSVKLWNLETQKIIMTLGEHKNGVNCIKKSQENLVLSCDNHEVRYWDLQSRTTVAAVCGRNGPAWKIKYFKNVLVTGTAYGYVEFWDDRNKREPLKSFRAHNEGISCLRIRAHDNNKITLVSGSRDKNIRVWSVTNAENMIVEFKQAFEGHTNEIEALKLLKNDIVLSSCWKEDEIRVWNMNSDRLVNRFMAHRSGTQCFAKTIQKQLISGGEDKMIRIWSYYDV